MSLPTTPTFRWPLPPDGAGQETGQPWGEQFREMITQLDAYLANITARGVVGADTPPMVPNVWDDEFNGDTLNPAWEVHDFGSGIIKVENGSLQATGIGGQGAGIFKALAPPFRVETKLVYASPHNYSWTQIALMLVDSVAQKFYSFGLQGRTNQGICVLNQRVYGNAWSVSNPANDGQDIVYPNSPYSSAYIGVEDDGTTLRMQISPDGFHWLTIREEPTGTWVNIDTVGLSMGGNDPNSGAGACPFYHFVPWIRRVR